MMAKWTQLYPTSLEDEDMDMENEDMDSDSEDSDGVSDEYTPDSSDDEDKVDQRRPAKKRQRVKKRCHLCPCSGLTHNLRRHQEETHSFFKKYPFHCNKCQKGYVKPAYLAKHVQNCA